MVIKNIGVIGAGQMGCGIAHVSALAGYRVHMYDLSKDRIEGALATINGNLARQVSNGKLSDDDRNTALGGISGSADLNDLAAMDLVIEAATEDESVKRKIYAQICPVLKPEALLATNTSSLSITRLASATDRSASRSISSGGRLQLRPRAGVEADHRRRPRRLAVHGRAQGRRCGGARKSGSPSAPRG